MAEGIGCLVGLWGGAEEEAGIDSPPLRCAKMSVTPGVVWVWLAGKWGKNLTEDPAVCRLGYLIIIIIRSKIQYILLLHGHPVDSWAARWLLRLQLCGGWDPRSRTDPNRGPRPQLRQAYGLFLFFCWAGIIL